MDRLKAALEEVVEIVKAALNGEPKSPVEILLDQYLPLEEDSIVSFSPKNRQAVAIPTFVLTDLASRTKNVVDCPYIQMRIWEILIDHQHNPNMMKKALNLLQYLLINGSSQVLKDCREPARSSFLLELAEDYNKYEYEQYEFSQHLDIGAGVRKTAADINALLEDDDVLFQARKKAEQLHQDLSSRGLRSEYPAQRDTSASGLSVQDESRPPVYTYFPQSGRVVDDIASRIVTHPSSDEEDYGEEEQFFK